MVGKVACVNTSRGGVPKLSVFEAHVTTLGLDRDLQSDEQNHGGPDRAVVLYSLELIHALQAEGHSVAPGTTGENLTVSGLDWPTLVPGTRLRVGEVDLEITRYASPCHKIGPSFLQQDFTRISQKVHPGWSRLCARVLTAGLVRPGDAVAVETGGRRSPTSHDQ
jgi:MOSC domain-containing protein YiiM